MADQETEKQEFQTEEGPVFDPANDPIVFTGNETELNKFNKSQVKDIEKLFTPWRRELFEQVKKQNIFHPFLYLKLLFTLPNKLKRFDFLFFKFRRLIKYFLNKLGFRFSLVGRI